jgi:glycosyltransferase involved in cell wall biosynthesis
MDAEADSPQIHRLADSGGRIRVLRVIARLNLGGPAHQAALLSGRRVDPDRFETLLVHGRLAEGEESMAYLADREGAHTVYLESLGQPVLPHRDLRALMSLRRLIRRFRPHVLHTHTAKAGFLGRQAALISDGPRPVIVHTYHGHVLEGYFGSAKSAVFRSLERRLARSTDSLVGVSEATVDDLVRLGVAGREQFRVVPLGLDLSAYDRAEDASGAGLRRRLGLRPDDLLAVFVGRLVPIKRVDVLLRAVSAARAEGASLHLAIVGNGQERARLEALAGDIGVSGAVHFLGYQRDLPFVFAAADIAALSSDNEGTPVSLIEAGAAGVPAVATDVGGVSEVVGADAGLLVPQADHAAMGRALARLASDQSLRDRMGAAARTRALERYKADRLVVDIERLYEELLASRLTTSNGARGSGSA